MKSRLTLPTVDALDADQARIHHSIMASRGNVDGPFLAWLHSPRLAETAQSLGAFCRYGTTLALVESELLILVVAAHYQCLGEQQIHEPIAIAAGLSEQTVDRLRAGLEPGITDERQSLLHELAHQLLATNRIVDATYQRAQAMLGTPTLVEVVGVIGYYGLVACTLNAFEMVKE
jgi:4-carboxymuconolactone decarboxylase